MSRFASASAACAVLPAVLVALAAAATSSGCLGRRPTPPIDVVLITIDTLRADHLGVYGDAHAATPVLDRLALHGARFTDVIATAPLTLPSHASILTGTTPLTHTVRDNGFVLPGSIPTLAERFATAGYATAAFVSGFPLHRRFGLARGFSVYDDRFTRADPGSRSAPVERPADETVSAAVTWIERERASGRPLFMWVHLFDPHAPYEPPQPFRTRFEQRPYDGEIAFVDAQVGVLLDKLKASREHRPAFVAVTADHGEGLGDHREPTHGLFVYDSTLRVPLIVAGPGVGRGQTIRSLVSLVDVAPTLLDVAGIAPLDLAEGVSVRPAWTRHDALPGPRRAYAESLFGELCCGWAPLHAWRDGRWAFIEAPRPELYDRDTDSAELHNVAAEHPDDVSRLGHMIESARGRERAPQHETVAGDARARLHSLGYAGGNGVSKPSMRDPKDMIDVSTRLGHAIELERAHLAQAAAILETVIRDDPDNPTARRHLGTVLLAEGQHDAAARVLLALEADGDRSAETAIALSDLAIARGDLDDARRRLERVYAASSEDVSIAFKLAAVLARMGAIEEAIPLFQAVLQRNPDDVDAAVDLGSALLQSGRAREALPYFLRAAQGGGNSSLVWNGLGFARLQIGDRAGAADAFQRSLRLDPNQPPVVEALRQVSRPP